MKSMIKNMSIEEREAMMLKMMPEMMKQADLKILFPNMLTTVGKSISLFGVYDCIIRILNNKKISTAVSDKVKELFSSMPTIMSNMMPLVGDMMKGFMPKMMPFMMPMMSEMMTSRKGEMTVMMESCKPEMKKQMAGCMQKMMPHCVDQIFPAIPSNEKFEFALSMIQTFTEKGSEDLEEADKDRFTNKAIEKIKTTTNNKEE